MNSELKAPRIVFHNSIPFTKNQYFFIKKSTQWLNLSSDTMPKGSEKQQGITIPIAPAIQLCEKD